MSFEILAAPPGVPTGTSKVRKVDGVSVITDEEEDYDDVESYAFIQRYPFDNIPREVLDTVYEKLSCRERLRLCATNTGFSHLCTTEEHRDICERETKEARAIVDKVFEKLNSAHYDDKLRALNTLAELGSLVRDRTDDIAVMLDDSDERIQRTALFALLRVGDIPSRHVDKITSKLTNVEARTTEWALRALIEGGGKLLPRHINAIAATLKSNNSHIRLWGSWALSSLHKWRKLSPNHFDAIVAKLDSDAANFLSQSSHEIISQTIDAMGMLKDFLTPAHVDAISAKVDKDEFIQTRVFYFSPTLKAIGVLGTLGELVKPRHIKLIADNLDTFVDHGLRALGSLGTLARSHANAVAAFLFGYHWKVAVETLKKMEAAEQYIDLAVDCMINKDKNQGLNLLEAFGKLSASRAGLIAEQLNDEIAEKSALGALGALGDLAKPYAKAVANKFMTAEDPLVKAAAIRALVSIGKIEPNVEKEITSKLLSYDPTSLYEEFIKACIEALLSLGKERMTTRHVDAIANQVKDRRSNVCEAAIHALVSTRELLNENHHVAIARKLAADGSGECAVLAAKALKSLGEITINVDNYLNDVVNYDLRDQLEWVRIYALRVLGEVGEKRVESIRRKLNSYDDNIVRREALKALVKLRKIDYGTVIEHLFDDSGVSNTASIVLAQMLRDEYASL